MTHSVNGQPVSATGGWDLANPNRASSFSPTAPASTSHPTSEAVMYANLVDAAKLIERMIERSHYSCSPEEAELIWRLRFVTRIEL